MTFDFFGLAHRLREQGEPFATATVVRAERPTSGKPGDRAIVTLTGELYGWIGGSCAAPTVIRESLAALADGESRLIRLSSEPEDQALREGITDLSMTCFSGGTMEIFIEPNPPRPRLVVVGEQAVARALAALGTAMGYEVVAVGGAGELAPGVASLAGPEAIGGRVHALTSVVVASHGEGDEVALEHALESAAPYVGLVASPKRAESIRKYLKVRGIPEERLSALHAPAGLDLNAREPEEIALSILAQIVQLRRTTARFDWRGAGEAADAPPSARRAPETAVDPVCGMTVSIAGAVHVHEHDGAPYYFCCGGCLAKFAAEPERYL